MAQQQLDKSKGEFLKAKAFEADAKTLAHAIVCILYHNHVQREERES